MRRPISKSLRFRILHRDGFRCQYCGAGAAQVQLHIDHRTPVALGGTNDEENLVTACIDCNLGKRITEVELDDGIWWDGMPCPFSDGWPFELEDYDEVYFLNTAWAVTYFGLQAVKEDYSVAVGALTAIMPDTIPPVGQLLAAMASKKWVAKEPELFVEAYLKALRVHEVTPAFDLGRSLQMFRTEATVTARRSGFDAPGDEGDDE